MCPFQSEMKPLNGSLSRQLSVVVYAGCLTPSLWEANSCDTKLKWTYCFSESQMSIFNSFLEMCPNFHSFQGIVDSCARIPLQLLPMKGLLLEKNFMLSQQIITTINLVYCYFSLEPPGAFNIHLASTQSGLEKVQTVFFFFFFHLGIVVLS